MIMHVQADTMMQNTGPGKVHTQFLFFNFFWVFDFLGYIQQTNSNATATARPLAMFAGGAAVSEGGAVSTLAANIFLGCLTAAFSWRNL